MLYITGITGHSGRWFLKRLEAEQYSDKIRCVMKRTKEEDPLKYQLFENTNLTIEFAIGDLEDESFLLSSLEGVDTIVHTAGIDKSPKLINAAIQCRVNWAILIHTTGRFSKYKSASSGYIQIEDSILNHRDTLLKSISSPEMKENGGINCTILRPTMIYGSSLDRNMFRLIGFLSKHKVFPLFGDGSNLMQPVHAKDLGNAYYEVLIRPEITMNKEYDLSGGKPIQYIDIIRCIRKALNSNIKLVKIPMGFSIFAAKLYNFLLGKHAIITVEQVLRMQEDKAFDHEAAARDFGYHPVNFEDGIQEEVKEYLSGVRVDFTEVKY